MCCVFSFGLTIFFITNDDSSDLQLAIALQQQEFEQQQSQQQRNPPNQASGIGNSRLIVGPQVSWTFRDSCEF